MSSERNRANKPPPEPQKGGSLEILRSVPMNNYTLFYSWQMDADKACNKDLIRDALLAVVKDPARIQDSPRFESGMEMTAGTPEVATVMFEKIQGCSIFVADTTLVGRITSTVDGREHMKKCLNPNVAIEMGFAAAHAGWDRIICVMNEAPEFGRRDEQAFDVRNRRFPINYSLSPAEAKDLTRREAALTRLTKDFRRAIDAVEMNKLRKTSSIRAKLDVRCLKLLDVTAKLESFSEPDAETIAQYPPLGNIPLDQFNAAVIRLLELGVLRADVQPRNRLYAYHWNYLGQMLLRDLGLR